jgi:peptide/nickel transport system permease protein
VTVSAVDAGRAAVAGRRRRWHLLPRVVAMTAAAAATVIVTSFVVFVALGFAPGDPVAQILGARASDAQRAAMRAQLGLDRPLLTRYWDWLTGALHGDFGVSLTYRQDVAGLLGPRLGTTLVLVVLALLITLVIGVAVGTLGGIAPRWRAVVTGLAGIGVAVPAFVAAALLISVFAVGLGWFPTYGAGSGVVDRLWHLLLPAVALSMSWSAYIAQITTAAVKEEVDSEHVATAIGRGLPRIMIIRRHVLRNALVPVLTVSGLMVGGLVAGSVVVESAFAIDGIGSLLVKSVLNKDYAVVNAVSLIIVLVFVTVMTLVDLVHTALDPRLRERS